MQKDILQSAGYLALGSRLKRLAERLQADAGKAHSDAGLAMQPAQYPLLAALDAYGPMTVGAAVEATGFSQPALTRTLGTLITQDLIEATRDEADSRVKLLRLSPEGEALVARLKTEMWPPIQRAAERLCDGGALLELIGAIEARLGLRTLEQRILHERALVPPSGMRLLNWDPGLARDFHEITRAWVEDMFRLEENDIRIIENPQELIIDRGGDIIFAETADLGVVGTTAIMPVEGRSFELTKMGVLSAARGRRAGEFLLAKAIERADEMRAAGVLDEFFLLTNQKCEAAIHLYEKLGFRHDANIMTRFGVRYERCNVAMSYGFD